MEKRVQFFKSFAEAEEADKKFYQSLTPERRIEILLILRNRYRSPDEPRGRLKRVVELLNALNVHYLVVGAFAVAYYGYPRFTADLDIFIETFP